ncbi:TetR/AcrR family transcriptional regulator [Planobispora siamensis]|uniref:TetR family transcriptional regulator n=1 Tax=Planobispora siamensis TaxID=936338 RepID=A0A8J3SD12_9ACTN|nr:TetR family transcriptional regulator [Planobispora siamensis]GIH91124.1 TetR family transcriptional regulator [Planobispora siamensis]
MRSENEADGQKKRSFIETARRAQIVACAIEVIAEVGYAQTSLALIAKRAGISKGVISYHFKGKDELIQQVVDEAFTSGDVFVRSRIEGQTTAAAMLRAYIEASVEFYRTHRAHMIALLDIWSAFRHEDGRPRLDTTANEPEMAAVEEILRFGQLAGEFREFSTRVMAVTLKQAVDGVLTQMAAYPDLDFDAYTRELVTTFDLATRKER